MDQHEINARVGASVSEADMTDMLGSQSIGTSSDDVSVRSGVLSFSFGPGGVVLDSAEQRAPIKSNSTGYGTRSSPALKLVNTRDQA